MRLRASGGEISRRGPAFWAAWALAAGLALRAYHYARGPSVWMDEAGLAVNILGKGYADLTGPLDHTQSAPPLFLWLEKLTTQVFGDSPAALRLLPFLASCAALVLLWRIAPRLVGPAAAPWAVLLLACSDKLLAHACETKPYSVDVLVAVAVLAGVVTGGDWPLGRRLAVACVLAPVVLLLSFPGCFLCGGVLVALLPAVMRAQSGRAWIGYGLLVAVVFGTFGLLFVGPVSAQRTPEMVRYWADLGVFPALGRPWRLPVWAVRATAGVCCYAAEPTGYLLLPLAVVGAWLLWRQGDAAAVAVLPVPLAAALAAGLVRCYPFGGNRLMAFAAPAVAVLAGAAVPAALDRLRALARPAAVVLAVVVAAPAGLCLFRAAVPWSRPDCAAAADYVLGHRRPADPVVAVGSWEYEYYFRRIGADYWSSIGGLGPAGPERAMAAGRVWALVLDGGGSVETHLAAVRAQLPDWRVADRHDFERTTAVLLERPTARAAAR